MASTLMSLPLFLESSSLSLASQYSDLYDRLRCSISSYPVSPSSISVSSSSSRDSSGSSASARLAVRSNSRVACVLDLATGTVNYTGAPGNQPFPIDAYLRQAKESGSLSRRFIASDSASYTWKFSQSNPRDSKTASWTCVSDVTGAAVAEYSINDRDVTGSSCAAMLTIEEQWSWMAVEILVTLTLMRHLSSLNNKGKPLL